MPLLAVSAGSAPRARGTRLAQRLQLLIVRISPACAGNTSTKSPREPHTPDQPRVRGEHLRSGRRVSQRAGSAPRARGTRAIPSAWSAFSRISPACAGNTSKTTPLRQTLPDQPRVRGEHSVGHADQVERDGSAPRARGTRRGERGGGQFVRISPACAGNTAGTLRAPGTSPDQPRVRGEHVTGTVTGGTPPGSAPRARGTRDAATVGLAHRRISPACAGNTATCANSSPCATDQPRVRGEHARYRPTVGADGGSAPRARGTRRGRAGARATRRISPACAGNTDKFGISRCEHRDQPRVRGEHVVLLIDDAHVLRISPACAGNTAADEPRRAAEADQPRVRGEHRMNTFSSVGSSGSAPRARGTRRLRRLGPRAQRISPACAGNTDPLAARHGHRADQPRVRGEHAADLPPGHLGSGSAPRARGTLLGGEAAGVIGRISPACAGNTSSSASAAR